ncbi:MAG TPA: tryptophan synthase subunit alpha [Virgibacillus sp.]|nr:tryptophan synthase subunit alpha [Virgibacillus sp.]HLR67399.1 tryptophan synthase subunit alpha [Virgibacillus sp.]
MSKQMLDKALADKRKAGEKIFVPYIMAGDGGLNKLEERLNFLQESGAAAVELGVPFSDPVADGPTIQESGQRSIANGTTLSGIFETLQTFREKRTLPIVFMTYLNPIYAYGIEKFAKSCEEAGVSGVIIPDLPMEEEDLLANLLKQHAVAFIRLAALTSPKERLRDIAARTEGFLYAVSVKGTTGARSAHEKEVHSYLQELKEFTSLPVLAGFGVSNAEQARKLGSACDGVIVGSKIVDLLHHGKTEAIKELIQGASGKKNISVN